MRRVRLTLLSAVLPVALLAAAGCGVLADTTAATVGSQTVSVDTVDALARDEEFATSVLGETGAADDESVLAGSVARTALGFAIQSAAWVAEADRLDVSLESSRAQAQDELAGAGLDGVGDEATSVLVDYVAAQNAVVQHYVDLAEQGTVAEAVEALYRAAPAYWRQVCFSGVVAPADRADEIVELLDGDVELADLPDAVEGLEYLPPSDQNCVSSVALGADLTDAVAATAVGELTPPVVVDDPSGATVYLLHIDERRNIDLDGATEELTQVLEAFADQSVAQRAVAFWTGLLATGAQVNPRYGSGVQPGAQGLTVLPPPVPVAPAAAPTPAAAPAGADTAPATAGS
jgi:hypothetical protein